MSKTPPLLADETLERVLRHGRANGAAVLVVGTVFALLGAAAGAVPPVMAWLLVAGTGAMALHGATLLKHGDARGLNWLISSQTVCLAFILSYCAWQLAHVDLSSLRAALTDDMRASVKETGLTEDEFLLLSYRLTYVLVAFMALIYQGTKAAYYLRRREAVIAALGSE